MQRARVQIVSLHSFRNVFKPFNFFVELQGNLVESDMGKIARAHMKGSPESHYVLAGQSKEGSHIVAWLLKKKSVVNGVRSNYEFSTWVSSISRSITATAFPSIS